jgi:hypothetical protein
MTRSSASDCRNCVCAGRGSGVLAGADAGRELQLDQFWSKRLGVSRKEPALAKAGGRIGIRCRSCRSPTACWPHGTSPWAEGPRAANGACIVSGFSAARWPTCWVKMPGWPESTSCTAVHEVLPIT